MGLIVIIAALGLGLLAYNSSKSSPSKLDAVYNAALEKETNPIILDEFARHLRDSGYNDKATFLEQKSISLKQGQALPMSVIQVPQLPQISAPLPQVSTTVTAPTTRVNVSALRGIIL